MGERWQRMNRARRVRRDGPTVADEAEAFVAGRYLSFCTAVRQPAPIWAHLNTVAHGTLAEVAEVARRPVDAEQPVLMWRHVEALIARQVLTAVAGDPGALLHLQASVLQPLEERIRVETRSRPVGARRVLALTRAALVGHPAAGLP